MAVRSSDATWNGNLKDGSGTLRLDSGAFEGRYSFASRFEEGTGTNPEELLAAAHAACYAMALSNALASDGHEPKQVDATAKVRLAKAPDGGFHIPQIDLVVEADVPGVDEDTFMQHARAMKDGCPVSKVLAGAEITLDATLRSS